MNSFAKRHASKADTKKKTTAARAAKEQEKGRTGLSSRASSRPQPIPELKPICGPTGWGIDEKVVVDIRDNTPYWIVTQYDGQIAASTRYLDKKKFRGVNAANFNKYAEEALRAEAAQEAGDLWPSRSEIEYREERARWEATPSWQAQKETDCPGSTASPQ